MLIGLTMGMPALAKDASNCTSNDPGKILNEYRYVPGEQISSSECQSVLTPAIISDSVYEDGAEARQAALEGTDARYVSDWTELKRGGVKLDTDYNLALAKESGFAAGVYETEDTVYVAFRGTDLPEIDTKKLVEKYKELGSYATDYLAGNKSIKDIMSEIKNDVPEYKEIFDDFISEIDESYKDIVLTDLMRATGEEPIQYVLAREVGAAAVESYANSGKKIVFTGHSLGGGLAIQAVSAQSKTYAQVFNSDGLTNVQLSKIPEDAKSRIDNIFLAYDPLHRSSWDQESNSLISEFVGNNVLNQIGNLKWVPNHDSCGNIDTVRVWSEGTDEVIDIIIKITEIVPGVSEYVSALPKTIKLAQVLYDSVKSHVMDTVMKNLKACAKSGPGTDTAVTDDHTTSSKTSSQATGDSDSNAGESSPNPGDGALPPEIKYHCVLSCD